MKKPKINFWLVLNLITSLILLILAGWLWLRLDRLETKQAMNQVPGSPLTVVLASWLTAVPTPMAMVTPFPPVDMEEDVSRDSSQTYAENENIQKPNPTPDPTVVDQGPNGRNWSLVTSAAAFGAHRALVPLAFLDKVWVLGGLGSNSVWSSVDGNHWDKAANQFYISSLCYSATVFKNRLWAVGGHFVVSSTDGVHWDLINDHPPFGSRTQNTLTAFNNRLWMIGGTGTGIMNDIWYSDDGKNWNCALPHAPFPQRRAFGTAVFQGKIWITGGIQDSVYTPLDDIWNSSDGFHWQQVQAGPHYEGRHSIGFTEYHNKLWVIAGDNGQIMGGGPGCLEQPRRDPLGLCKTRWGFQRPGRQFGRCLQRPNLDHGRG